MKHFEIAPLGMAEEDLDRIGVELDEKMAVGSDFLLVYHSMDRRIALCVMSQVGRITNWLMLPCPRSDFVPLLQAWYAGEMAAQLRAQEQAAKPETLAMLDRVRHPFR